MRCIVVVTGRIRKCDPAVPQREERGEGRTGWRAEVQNVNVRLGARWRSARAFPYFDVVRFAARGCDPKNQVPAFVQNDLWVRVGDLTVNSRKSPYVELSGVRRVCSYHTCGHGA